jgi:hypothetical protein
MSRRCFHLIGFGNFSYLYTKSGMSVLYTFLLFVISVVFQCGQGKILDPRVEPLMGKPLLKTNVMEVTCFNAVLW